MTVTTILSKKGGEIVSIGPAATLVAAVKLLAARRIGAVVVLGVGGRLVGILSERDIVRAVAERGADALNDTVAHVMTRDVLTCSADEPIDSIMERMTAGKFRHMPVIERAKLIGIVSIGDVVKERLDDMAHEAEALRTYIQTA